jgi:hypothetical protein
LILSFNQLQVSSLNDEEFLLSKGFTDSIKNIFLEVLQPVTDKINQIEGSILSNFNNLFSPVTNIVNNLENNILTNIETSFPKYLSNGLSNTIISFEDRIVQNWPDIFKSIYNRFKEFSSNGMNCQKSKYTDEFDLKLQGLFNIKSSTLSCVYDILMSLEITKILIHLTPTIKHSFLEYSNYYHKRMMLSMIHHRFKTPIDKHVYDTNVKLDEFQSELDKNYGTDHFKANMKSRYDEIVKRRDDWDNFDKDEIQFKINQLKYDIVECGRLGRHAEIWSTIKDIVKDISDLIPDDGVSITVSLGTVLIGKGVFSLASIVCRIMTAIDKYDCVNSSFNTD